MGMLPVLSGGFDAVSAGLAPRSRCGLGGPWAVSDRSAAPVGRRPTSYLRGLCVRAPGGQLASRQRVRYALPKSQTRMRAP